MVERRIAFFCGLLPKLGKPRAPPPAPRRAPDIAPRPHLLPRRRAAPRLLDQPRAARPTRPRVKMACVAHVASAAPLTPQGAMLPDNFVWGTFRIIKKVRKGWAPRAGRA